MSKNFSAAPTPARVDKGSDGNEGVFNIPQSLGITGSSSSERFVPYPEHSLRVYNPAVEM